MFFTEEINKMVLINMMIKKWNQLIQYKICAHRTSTDLVSEKEEIKCNNIIKQHKRY